LLKKSEGTVRLKVSVFIEGPEGALTLIAFDGTETEQAADGALTEQCIEGDTRPPHDGNEPIVARSGDSPRLRQRGFNVTERAAELVGSS